MSLVPEDLRPVDWQWAEERNSRPWWIADFPGDTSAWGTRYWWLEDPASGLPAALTIEFRKYDALVLQGHDAAEVDVAVLLRELRSTYGTDVADAYIRYVESRRRQEPVLDVAQAYDAMLRLLPSSETVIAERVRTVLSSGDPDWAVEQLRVILRTPQCPLWIRAAGAFGWLAGLDPIHVPESDPVAVLSECAGPNVALLELLDLVPKPQVALPGWDADAPAQRFLSQGMTSTEGTFWGVTDLRDADETALARVQLLGSATIVSALLNGGEPPRLARWVALVPAAELLLDALLRQGQVQLAAKVATLLDDSLLQLEGELQPMDDWMDEDGTSDFPLNWAQLHTWCGGVAAACAVFGRPRASLLSATSLPDSVRAILSAVPPDVVLGGEASPEAVVARLEGLESQLGRLAARPPTAADAKERGLKALELRIGDVDALGWVFQDELLVAFGHPDDWPTLSVMLARASAVEKMMHLTFPGLPAEESLGTLADKLGKNNRYGVLRVLSAAEGKHWAAVIERGRRGRNRSAHPSPGEVVPEAAMAFWLPERYPPGTSASTVFDLLRLFAEVQSARLAN